MNGTEIMNSCYKLDQQNAHTRTLGVAPKSGKALDRKSEARILKFPSIVWAADPRTIDSYGEQ